MLAVTSNDLTHLHLRSHIITPMHLGIGPTPSHAVGSRISDSSENLFADDQTLWACGYVDQQVPGMMYLGEATGELNESAKSGTLAVTL